MKVVNKDITEIRPYSNNPRLIPDDAIEKVANSIEKFGFQQPLVLDKDNIIIVGHTRFLASKQLGLTEVPCTIADNLTEEEVKAYRLADNKVADFTNWDIFGLRYELNKLELDMSIFGFEDTNTKSTKPSKVQITFSFNKERGDFIKDYFANNKGAKRDIADKLYDMIVKLNKDIEDIDIFDFNNLD